MQTYTPDEKHFKDVYIVEKTETNRAGLLFHLMKDGSWVTSTRWKAFYRSAAFGYPIESDSVLAADTIATIRMPDTSLQRREDLKFQSH